MVIWTNFLMSADSSSHLFTMAFAHRSVRFHQTASSCRLFACHRLFEAFRWRPFPIALVLGTRFAFWPPSFGFITSQKYVLDRVHYSSVQSKKIFALGNGIMEFRPTGSGEKLYWLTVPLTLVGPDGTHVTGTFLLWIQGAKLWSLN